MSGLHAQAICKGSGPKCSHHMVKGDLQVKVVDLQGQFTKPVHEYTKGFAFLLLYVNQSGRHQVMGSSSCKLCGEKAHGGFETINLERR